MANVVYDGSELKAWIDDIERLSSPQGLYMIAENTLSLLAKEIIEVLKRNTPVGETDYKIILNWDDNPGELRRAWDSDNTVLKVTKTISGFAVSVVNNTEHASWVNDGRRQNLAYKDGTGSPRFVKYIGARLVKTHVQGSYFLEKSETEYSLKMDRNAQKNIEVWLRKVFER